MHRVSLLQPAVAALLLGAASAFPASGVPLFCERRKSVRSQIDASIGSAGICAWVMPPIPVAALSEPAASGFLTEVHVKIRIIEASDLNTTPYDAFDLWYLAAAALHGHTPLDPEGRPLTSEPLSLAEEPADLADDGADTTLDLILRTALQL